MLKEQIAFYKSCLDLVQAEVYIELKFENGFL